MERGADMVRERRGSGWREVRKKREKDKGTSEEKARDEKKRLRAILKNDDLCGWQDAKFVYITFFLYLCMQNV